MQIDKLHAGKQEHGSHTIWEDPQDGCNQGLPAEWSSVTPDVQHGCRQLLWELNGDGYYATG
jgi:hypothetical protein